MSKYKIHKDYSRLNIQLPLNRFILPSMQYVTKKLFDWQRCTEGITHRKITIPGYEKTPIEIEVFTPEGAAHSSPCLLFLHGGAFALNAVNHHKRLICDYAAGSQCKVVLVNYRLSPRYPYPYGLEDSYAACKWVYQNYQSLGFDPHKIALCGDSAGGCLAAGLTHLVRERLKKNLLFQMLIYPVLDFRMTSKSMKDFYDTPIWNSRLNRKMWDMYLQQTNPEDIDYFVSPILAESLKGMPPAYIEVCEFDCLRDEGLEYYNMLISDGVDALLNKTAGTIHGFEVNYDSAYTREIIKERINYMNKLFYATHG
jgi:acetyl esterase